MTPLYKIEERSPTTGDWFLIDEESQKMTKEQTLERWEHHLRNEMNPNYMRVVREQ